MSAEGSSWCRRSVACASAATVVCLSLQSCSSPALCFFVLQMETPDIGVPDSQFELEKAEARKKKPKITIERRSVNKHTEMFRA